MFKAIGTFFAFLTTLFSAADHGAKAIEHWSIYAEEASKHSVDTLRIENAKTIEAMAE